MLWETTAAGVGIITDHPADGEETAGGAGGPSRQMGDTEARLWFAPDDTAALRGVAVIIRPRVRRSPMTGNPEALARARAARDVGCPALVK